jgi:hypothetical protein
VSPRPLAGLLLALLVVTGCSVSRAGPPIPTRSAAPASTPSTTQSTTPSTKPSTTPPSSTSAEPSGPIEPDEPELPLITAADGTDVAACRDGVCEVAVSGPVTIELPAGTLTITSAGPDGVDFELAAGSGGGSGNLRGFCLVTFFPGGLTSSCPVDAPGPPPRPAAGRVNLQLIGVTAEGAPVLRVVAG